MLRQCREKKIAGGRSYDAAIAACARKVKAAVLLTWNYEHFAPFQDKNLRINYNFYGIVFDADQLSRGLMELDFENFLLPPILLEEPTGHQLFLVYTCSDTTGGSAMSKILSLKLKDEVFCETEDILKRRKTPRNAYFNEAINLYNKLWKRKLLKEKLARESRLVSNESLVVLEEFEAFEDELGR